MRAFRVLGALTLTLGALGAWASAADGAPNSTAAVAYQGSATHEGDQTSDTLSPPLVQKWSRNLGGAVSYPLIVGGTAYVTVAQSGGGSSLYALNLATGSTQWGPIALGGPYSFSGIAYDSGEIFALNYAGILREFDATSGVAGWSVQLPGQYSFTSPPTAANGLVYTGGAGSGGTVYAVHESDGSIAWTASVENGDDSSPAVTASGVYVSYACDQAYDFDPTTGALIWHHTSGCEGGGGKTVAVHDGRVYTRDAIDGNLVLDASTGALLGAFNASTNPAFDGQLGFFLNGGTLSAATESGTTKWSFTGDGHLVTAPIVDDGIVYVGSSSGLLYGLSESTGAVVWSTNVGAGFTAPDEQNAVALTGLAAAQGNLVAPAGNVVTDYVPLADFTLTMPSSVTIGLNGSGAVTVTLQANGNFAGPVTLTVTGVPAKSTGTLSPTTVTLVPNGTGSSRLTIKRALTQLGDFTVTVTGCYQTTCHSAAMTVKI